MLDRALEPALDDHLKRLDALDETDAAEALFDFRVADIAIGSGHFLVAAIDRIEKRIADYLSRRSLTGVRAELADLRGAAEKGLGADSGQLAIEDTQLLRRLIARRCIYGVDLNRLSVELSRLSIWIHTFVPGLPLTMLEHKLVHGNALVGIGTIDDIRRRFEAEHTALFGVDADNLLGQARQPLARLADASLKDVAAARDAMEQARVVWADAGLVRHDRRRAARSEDRIPGRHQGAAAPGDSAFGRAAPGARRAWRVAPAAPFPVAFPEVFLRRRAGFDVIVGNPPWQEATIEEHAFWGRHLPGLRGLPQRELEHESEVAPLQWTVSRLASYVVVMVTCMSAS